jgi:hypothetical protein
MVNNAAIQELKKGLEDSLDLPKGEKLVEWTLLSILETLKSIETKLSLIKEKV